MYSVYDSRCRVGCPIRISTDQRLLAAPRGFSQRATSFIASWCQGIHRMPFLYSISRLGPSGPNLTMHRNHPQVATSTLGDVAIRTASGNIVFSAHNTIFPNGHFRALLTQSVERSIRQNRSPRL